jgi:hypothetical protein
MLPKIDTPLYELELPLLKKKVQFRPFLVKEEKILLMAMESEDENSVVLGIKQIMRNCLLSDIDIEDLPILDFEYLFLNLRARSVGETIDLQYKCNNDIPGSEEDKTHKCGNLISLSFNALEVKPEINEINGKIQLTPKLGVVLKYPTFKAIENVSLTENKNPVDFVSETIISSIDYIYDEENIYYAKDTPKEELVDFIDSLTKDQFAMIQKFFEDIPKLSKKIDFKCNKCGYEENIEIQGIQSFFV